MTRAPLAAAQSRLLRILKVEPSALPAGIEGAYREDARARRRAHQFAMGRYQSGDGGAVLVRCHRRRSR